MSTPGSASARTVYRATKRVLDFVLALLVLVLILPAMGVVSLAILVTMGRPILFKQVRPGLKERPFLMIKFRSMSSQRDGDGKLLSDASRLTKLGRFLRASSLDELPEIWNVLIGDMSFVGPRPLLMEYVPLYSQEQRRRHDVRPGITGWAQVNGRNAISWQQKFELDVWYVDNRSFLLDVRILWLTVVQVLRSADVSQPGFATAEKFSGNSSGESLSQTVDVTGKTSRP